MRKVTVQEAQRDALKAAARLSRAMNAPVLVAVFDVEYQEGSTVVIATRPDRPGDAAVMVEVLHEGLVREGAKITHLCACGDPNCISLEHYKKTGAITES